MLNFAVYILASYRHGTLYTGMTADLARRVYEHKIGVDPKSFSYQYKTHFLVYYEFVSSFAEAFAREKALKGTNRNEKIRLIRKMNPAWLDLYNGLL